MRNSHENHITSDLIINQVDEEFSLQLTKLIKNYVLDLVNHEVDVITDSDWFEEKIKTTMEELKWLIMNTKIYAKNYLWKH